MKKTIVLLLIAALLTIAATMSFAANDTASHTVTMQVNEVALIDLNNTSNVLLTTTAPTNGGEAVTGTTDSSKLLQYTSLVSAGSTRRITVNWGGSDAAPAGTSLKLEAVSVPASGGSAAGQITVGSTATDLITGIGSVATGTGANGAALTYTFSVDTVTSLVVGASQTVTITFTLTDQA